MKKYNILYCDPPWQFSNKKTGGSMKSGSANQYPVMTIDSLKKLDIESITEDDCALIMWWVGAMPQEAIDLVNAWGFTIKNMNAFVWNKITQKNKPHFGMGFYTRAGSESCLIATKGKIKPLSHSVRAVFNAECQIQFEGKVSQHSKKPVQVRDLIVELFGGLPRLEMFARTKSEGWDVFGNEVEGSIEINAR